MSVQTQLKRITVPEIRSHKGQKPVVCLTCYHAHTARLLDNYVDLMLVGDSLGMVMHGLETTLGVKTLDDIIDHAEPQNSGSRCSVEDRTLLIPPTGLPPSFWPWRCGNAARHQDPGNGDATAKKKPKQRTPSLETIIILSGIAGIPVMAPTISA